METPVEIQPGLHLLPSWLPVPTLGLLPVNAFLVKGEEPYLVDTGMLADGDAFVRQVESLIDPAELRWIYLTHTDPDHIGALLSLVERAPRARLITTFIAFAKLQIGLRPIAPDRVYMLNPGERLDLPDRTLTVYRPPVLDAPETTMVHDSRLDALFSADAFGAPLEGPTRLANDLSDAQLEPRQLTWVSIDAPWIHYIDRQRFDARMAEVANLDPAWILSTHLPPARQMARAMCRSLCRAPDAAPYHCPDQPAFEEILRQAAGAPPP